MYKSIANVKYNVLQRVYVVRVLQKSDKVSANPLSEITRWIYIKYEYCVILFYKIL